MPELDYVVLADYVRQDAGVTHIIGAGIDTFFVPEGQPVAVPAGVVVRITFSTRDEVGGEHDISLVWQGPEGELLRVGQRFPVPARAPGVPEHWRTAVNILFRFLILPVPMRGDYLLQVTIDDDPRLSRSVDIRAVAPPAPQS